MADQTPHSDHQQQAREFERQASRARTSLWRELFYFLATTKKWWLAPIIVALLLLGTLFLLAGTGAAPFIYTLF